MSPIVQCPQMAPWANSTGFWIMPCFFSSQTVPMVLLSHFEAFTHMLKPVGRGLYLPNTLFPTFAWPEAIVNETGFHHLTTAPCKFPQERLGWSKAVKCLGPYIGYSYPGEIISGIPGLQCELMRSNYFGNRPFGNRFPLCFLVIQL